MLLYFGYSYNKPGTKSVLFVLQNKYKNILKIMAMRTVHLL